MAVTAHASGTKTVSSIGTPENLTTAAVAGTFTLHVDTVNMAAGDVLELRIKQMILTERHGSGRLLRALGRSAA